MIEISRKVTVIIPYLVFYIILILIHGYTYGANDQMDFMPYARHLQDPSLYIHDFYINCIGSRFNERWLLAHAVAIIPHAVWPTVFLMIHFSCTLLLLSGLKKWAALFIQSEFIQWSSIVMTLVLLYHRNLGGNELYYNMVCASLISKAIAVWALYYSYHANIKTAVLLTLLSAYLHPIVGTQILILSFFILPTKNKLHFLLISVAGLSPYLYSLFGDIQSSIPAGDFVQSMHFRNAHHFFPLEFGILNYILLLPLFLLGMIIFYRKNVRVFNLMATILIGCLIYTAIMAILPQYAIMCQWFKTTIWIKFFSVIGFWIWLINLKPSLLPFGYRFASKLILLGFFLIFIGLKVYKNTHGNDSFYLLPWSHASQEILASINGKNQSQPNDIFIVPADFTAFKYYSERSTYVDWKAIPHNGECLGIWRERITLAYGLRDENRSTLAGIYAESNDHLSNLTAEQKADLKAAGVTYVCYRLDPKMDYVFLKL